MKHICKTCNYQSNDKSNFNRHMNSSSHSKLTQRIDTSVNSKRLVKTICSNCNETFSSPSSLSRHKNKYCKTNQINLESHINQVNQINKINNENHNLDIKKQVEECVQTQIKLHELQETIKKKEIEIENKFLKQQIMELKEFINSGKAAPTYNSISIKKYIQQNYSDAPPLKSLTDYSKLKYEKNDNSCEDYSQNTDDEINENDGDNEDDFVSTLSYNYNNKNLHKYLGDFIIKYYKKEDPSQQSMWASDTSRLTYIIKELLSTNESIWNHDYKGIKTKKYIINPLLKYIKECVNDFWMNNIDKFKDLSIDELIKLQKIYSSIYNLKKDIENETISNNIIKYISSHFCMDRNDNNSNMIEYFIDK